MAAELLTVVADAWYGMSGGVGYRQTFADLDQYAHLLSRDPNRAQQTLRAAYRGQPSSPDQAVQALGYMPVALRRAPAGGGHGNAQRR